MDDIKGVPSASEAVKPPPPSDPRSVGPESEARGGPEAPNTTLDDDGSETRDQPA